MIHRRAALADSLSGVPSAVAGSPDRARSLTKAIHLPSGLHSGFSSLPECVSGRRPVDADQSQRSLRKVLAFQSGVLVAMTADEPSGAMRAAEISVVLRNSSNVIAGLVDSAKEAEEGRHTHRAKATHRNRKRIG